MERERKLALAVGSFVLVSLLALAIGILSLGSESGYFVPQYRLVARFENVQGLLPGAPVWLAGKEVGRVEEIRFEPVGAEMPVLVTLRIDRDVQDRIRGDSVATIGTIGVLGDAYVEVRVGSVEAPMLEAGAELRAQSPINLNLAVAKGSRALDNVATLAQNLNLVVEAFTAESGGQKAAGAISAARDIMISIQQGPGLLHNLIYDRYEGEGIQSIERSLTLLEQILEEIHSGDGILHTLIFEEPTDQQMVMEAVSAGARLNSILEKVDRGEGTIGLLVNDPSVYEDLQTLLGGAQRSLIVRSMIRMATEKPE